MSEMQTPEAVNAAINETLALLDTKYNFDEVLGRNVVLFVGITGAGKSTACQFLAGNPKLSSVKDVSTNSFHISDGDNKVSESNTESKTLLPELVPIPDTDTVLVDCPGFSDTRGAKYDIAATYFTKQVLDKSEDVKIMVTTPYHSVQSGVDRSAFTNLLGHLVRFIKDVDKFKNSIGLLVTKVDNPTGENQDGNFQLIPDELIVEGIGGFLENVKDELLNTTIAPEQIELVNIFIEKNDSNEYSRIGIFGKPLNDQNVHTNKRLKKNKNAIKNIMNNVVLPSHATPNDFGLSLSVDSISVLSKMRGTLNTRCSQIIEEYTRAYSQHQLHSMANNLESIKTAISRSKRINALLQTNFTTNKEVTNLLEGIQGLDPEHPAQQSADWKHQQNYLQILESISPSNEDYNNFRRYQQQFDELKNQILNNVKMMGKSAEKILDRKIGDVITEVVLAVKNETVNLEASPQRTYNELSKQIEDIYKKWHQFQINHLKKPNLQFKEFLNDFRANFNVSESQVQQLESYQREIDFFKNNVTTTLTDGHQMEWLQGINGPLNEIKKIVEWFSFIVESYAKLASYDSKSVVTDQMGHLKNWTDFKMMRKQLGTDADLDRFLESRPTLSTKEQSDLNNLIDSIQSSLEHTCESSRLVIQDNLVVLSKVMKDLFLKCPSFNELYIFARQTVFIDESLVGPGKNVYIFAPIWSIENLPTINLRGSDALSKNLNASEMAGDPGQPGGNFFGAGNKFINGNRLTVDVSGGKGGKGADGQNGHEGKNGANPKKTPGEKNLLVDRKFRFDREEHKLYGTDGEPGSRGSDGGKGGDGGMPGNITVNSPEIHKLVNLGPNGAVGVGGKGGKGGKNGNMYRCKDTYFKDSQDYYNCENAGTSQGNAANGTDGVPGVLGTPKTPANPQPFKHIVAHDYNQYARQKPSLFVKSLELIDPYILNDNNRRRRSIHPIHAAPIGDNINWTPQHLAIDHKTENLENKSWGSEFSLSSFVTLADVFIRKLMRIKPTPTKSQIDPTWENLLVQAEVLNIVERCEAKWNEVNQKQKQFDPVCLQKELTRRMKKMADRTQLPEMEAKIMKKLLS